MPQLICHVTNDYPQIFDLIDDQISIGRDDENEIYLLEDTVSINHAELIKKEDGSYRVKDLGSSNGTYVNREKIIDTALTDGDRLEFGSVKGVYLQQSGSLDRVYPVALNDNIRAKTAQLEKLKKTTKIDLKKLDPLQDQDSNIAESNGEIYSDLLKLGSEVQEQEKKLEELQKQRESQLKDKEDLDSKLELLTKEIEETEAKHAEIEAKASDELGKKLSDREQELETLTKEIEGGEQAYKELGKEIDQRSDTLAELDALVKNKEKEVAKLAETVTKNNTEIQGFSGKLASMESSLALVVANLAKTEEKEKSLQKENETLSQIISEKANLLQQVKAKISDHQQGKVKSVCPPLRVIQSGTSFLVHYFNQGPGNPGEERVEPVGCYSLAACSKGSVHREFDTIPSGDDPLLLLLSGDFEQDRALIQSVSNEMPDQILLVCLSEGQLDPKWMANHAKLLTKVSGIISVDPMTAQLVDTLKLDLPHLSIPLPCPVDYPDWVVPVQKSKRAPKILLSADGFDPISLLGESRLELVNQLVEQSILSGVTLYETHDQAIPGLKIPKSKLSIVPADLSYSEYLALLSEHAFVTSLGDTISGVNIGDALLAQNVFVGGDFTNSVDEMLYPKFCIQNNDIDPVLNSIKQSINNQAAYQESIDSAQIFSHQLISYAAASDQINDFIESISKKAE